MSAEAKVGPLVLGLSDEHRLTRNEGWLVLLHLLASAAAESGMTLEETQARVGKAFGIYKDAYAARARAEADA